MDCFWQVQVQVEEEVLLCQREALGMVSPFLLSRCDVREIWTLRLASLVALKQIISVIYIQPTDTTTTSGSSSKSVGSSSLLTSNVVDQLLTGETR